MTFATPVGTADVVIPASLLAVVSFRDALGPQIRVMLTTPSVIHDAAVIHGSIGIETERCAALARRNLDGRRRWIWIGNGRRDRGVVARIRTRADVSRVGRARDT